MTAKPLQERAAWLYRKAGRFLSDGPWYSEITSEASVLPDDERLLAAKWLLVDRSLFDVTAVRRDEGLTARDLRTGDSFEVRDRAASRSLKPGELICARIVPAGCGRPSDLDPRSRYHRTCPSDCENGGTSAVS